MADLALNLGSGKDWRKDSINADIQPEKKPDWIMDICKVPWGNTIDTRLGRFTVQEGMFGTIIANDVLEHIPDLVTAMTNCKQLLKSGGEMHIHVPYDLSYGAWQDPTHVRAFNENSFLYYTDWHWYLNWPDKFTLTQMGYELSPVGQELMEKKVPQDVIFRTPRAVDALQVILTKD
jgi:SAM-dependent methyltransferase